MNSASILYYIVIIMLIFREVFKNYLKHSLKNIKILKICIVVLLKKRIFLFLFYIYILLDNFYAVLIFRCPIFILGYFSRTSFSWSLLLLYSTVTYLPSKRCFKKSKRAFCIISVTSYPFRDGPTSTTGLIDGTTS